MVELCGNYDDRMVIQTPTVAFLGVQCRAYSICKQTCARAHNSQLHAYQLPQSSGCVEQSAVKFDLDYDLLTRSPMEDSKVCF